jgi:hypothetical protein
VLILQAAVLGAYGVLEEGKADIVEAVLRVRVSAGYEGE